VIVGDFNTPLSPKDRSSRQKIKKETLELNVAIDQMDLTDIHKYSTLLQHNMPFKIDHILYHKVSLNKCKKTEITHCILSDLNAIKLL
jgi:endonuclease/exonuclease/phosphatase family metal-dependent hydrolase